MHDINNKDGWPEKSSIWILPNQKQYFFWFYIIILTVAVCISTEHKFQALENLFWYPFPLGSVSKHFTKNEMKKLELNCTVCDLQLTIMPLKQNSYLMWLFDKKTQYKMILRFMKSVFVAIFNSDQNYNLLFMVSLGRHTRSYDTFDNLSERKCASSKKESVISQYWMW